MITLDGNSLTLDDLVAVAHDFAPVTVAPAAMARVRAAREVVDRLAQGDAPIYGINTGFGSFAETRIPAESLDVLQLNLLRSHAAGVGEPLPVPAVRAMMALRANVLAKGFSGIRPETLQALVDLLNHRVHPVVPARGSVGASGDLAPLAHLALVLIGERSRTRAARASPPSPGAPRSLAASSRETWRFAARASRRRRSRRRKGSRSSTAPRPRPRSSVCPSRRPSGWRGRPTSSRR
jgi:histidine ammonia-lyase